MGTWGTGAFENDAACDWSADLTEVADLSMVEHTLSSAEDAEDDELDVDLACEAIAACEVVARLQGRGRGGTSTDEIDRWVRAQHAKPSPALIRLATTVLDRVAHERDLAMQWQDKVAWQSSLLDLRRRVAG